MRCVLCEERKGRRLCPAVGREICAVCCGTKRLAEINCPADCVYLESAKAHPAAVVRRQHEQDAYALLPGLKDLDERAADIFWLALAAVRDFRPDDLVTLRDDDVADAMAALAATLETASKGVIYEHRAGTVVSQQLADSLRALLEQVQRAGALPTGTATTAAAVRAVERVARTARKVVDGGDRAFVALAGRVTQGMPPVAGAVGPQPDKPTSSGLIVLP